MGVSKIYWEFFNYTQKKVGSKIMGFSDWLVQYKN